MAGIDGRGSHDPEQAPLLTRRGAPFARNLAPDLALFLCNANLDGIIRRLFFHRRGMSGCQVCLRLRPAGAGLHLPVSATIQSFQLSWNHCLGHLQQLGLLPIASEACPSPWPQRPRSRTSMMHRPSGLVPTHGHSEIMLWDLQGQLV